MSIKITATTKEAYELFHEGSLALAEAEFNGIRCDRDYCEKMIANLARQEKALTAQLEKTDLGIAFKQRYRNSTNFGSDHQLRQILYTDMGLQTSRKTRGGKKGQQLASVDNTALESLGRDDVRLLLRIRNVQKMGNTYLKNLLQESEADGYIHPFFHLNSYDDDKGGGARSYRGSSSDPNFQNQPNRHEQDRKLVRRAFLPRPGHRLVGRDYGGIEVRISACNHQDKNMIRYIEQGDDMHRDCASMAFLLPQELCTKKAGRYGGEIRQTGKNAYVFPQFYLQQPENTARGLWGQMVEMPLRMPNDPDKTVQQHLKEKGIKSYDAFEKHIIKVIEGFWTDMFPGFKKWRDKHIEAYNRKGYFDMLTGFRVEGVLTPFQLGNYPIQGPAFHCLLWSLIQVNKLWKGKGEGWRSKIVGQIHDELTTDEHDEEFQTNQQEVIPIMAEDIRKHWDWIIVPLEVEADATPVDGNWFEKKEVR